MTTYGNLAAVAIMVPFVAAAVVAALGHIAPRPVTDLLSTATMAATVVLCAVVLRGTSDGQIVHWFGGWTPRDGFPVGVDLDIGPLSAGLATFVAVLGLASTVFSWRYLKEIHSTYHSLILVFVGAMVGF
ncbi:MAG: mnhD, partial [Acidimicrobiia bacterium]|nr:mnhD [Acidimicrobiia bacterium]